MTDENGRGFPLLIVSLNESTDGNFTARAQVGGCTGTAKGTISSSDSLNFTLTEDLIANCGLVGTFSGQLFSDSHIAGDWKGAESQVSGTWTAS
ncbi:MAG: hypothetical protein NVSMB49_01400 [Ktedonobacteraceae bacterium]